MVQIELLINPFTFVHKLYSYNYCTSRLYIYDLYIYILVPTYPIGKLLPQKLLNNCVETIYRVHVQIMLTISENV